MTTYERRLNGRVVPGSRQIPEPGMYDDTRLGLLVLERRESGERDGWYEDGEWDAVEAARAELEQDYEGLTVEDLRERLRKLGQPVSGDKAALIMRLHAAELEEASTDDEPQEG